jgi:hypothetical protein
LRQRNATHPLTAAYQFLVKQKEVIVGRVNLSGVTRPYSNKASHGYRIGERLSDVCGASLNAHYPGFQMTAPGAAMPIA